MEAEREILCYWWDPGNSHRKHGKDTGAVQPLRFEEDFSKQGRLDLHTKDPA